MRLSCRRKTVTTLRGITWETSDTTRVSTTRRKAQNGQDDSSSVGCSPESFLRLAEAEVRDTDFPSPFQLSVPFAEVETADSPPVGGVSPRYREHKKAHVYHVYPTLGKPNSCYANVHRLGVFFLCLPSSSYRVWRLLCLFAIDVVVLRFSGVTFDPCSVWGRFVSFRSRLGLFALCCANVCPLGVSFVWVCHRCHIAFLWRDVTSLFFTCVPVPFCMPRAGLFIYLAVLIDRAASGHKRRRNKGTTLSRSRKPVSTLRGITSKT